MRCWEGAGPSWVSRISRIPMLLQNADCDGDVGYAPALTWTNATLDSIEEQALPDSRRRTVGTWAEVARAGVSGCGEARSHISAPVPGSLSGRRSSYAAEPHAGVGGFRALDRLDEVALSLPLGGKMKAISSAAKRESFCSFPASAPGCSAAMTGGTSAPSALKAAARARKRFVFQYWGIRVEAPNRWFSSTRGERKHRQVPCAHIEKHGGDGALHARQEPSDAARRHRQPTKNCCATGAGAIHGRSRRRASSFAASLRLT